MIRFFAPIVQPRTYRNLAYLSFAFPIGLFYFVFLVTGLSVGFGTLPVGVGFFILFGMILAARGLGSFERELHRNLLDVEIEPPRSSLQGEEPLLDRVRGLLTDPVTWRTMLWLGLRFPSGLATFVILVTMLAAAGGLLLAPVFAGIDSSLYTAGWDFGPVVLDPHPVWTIPLGVGLFFVTLHVTNGLGWIHGVLGKALLGPSAQEQVRTLEQRTTVLQERTKLAHELHDAVGHTVTMMVVQAGAGRKVFESDPEFAKSTLETIESSGRRALNELDRVLGLLRDNESPRLSTAPLLDDIPELVSQVRSTGMLISVDIEGTPSLLPPDVQTAAYRVVQESLTNVVKHAGDVFTQITIRHRPDWLEVEVTNHGDPVSPDHGLGHGIIGIRERVAAFGGEAYIGPRIEGGFRVWVRFPLT